MEGVSPGRAARGAPRRRRGAARSAARSELAARAQRRKGRGAVAPRPREAV